MFLNCMKKKLNLLLIMLVDLLHIYQIFLQKGVFLKVRDNFFSLKNANKFRPTYYSIYVILRRRVLAWVIYQLVSRFKPLMANNFGLRSLAVGANYRGRPTLNKMLQSSHSHCLLLNYTLFGFIKITIILPIIIFIIVTNVTRRT